MIERLVSKIWPLIVGTAAISISTWSLYWLGRHVGMPPILAGVVSAAFDGGAAGASLMSLKWARIHGVSGMFARFAMLLFASSSVYLNISHARLAHFPVSAEVLFAMPSIIALTSIELYLRFENRGALKRAGKIPEALPVINRAVFMFHPIASLSTLRRIAGYRLAAIESRADGSGNLRTPQGTLETVSNSLQIDPTPLRIPPGYTAADVREWARDRGHSISDRGPLPQSVLAAYLDAMTGRETPELDSAVTESDYSALNTEVTNTDYDALNSESDSPGEGDVI